MSIYTLRHQVRRLDEELCGNGRKYSTGDVLFSDRGERIVLGKLIAEGGEGSVLVAHSALGSPLVAKLYHPTQRMRWREQKLRLMCSRPIRSPCVAWPQDILYDELKRFVGVLMPRADGVPLGAFAFHAELLTNQFPSWTRYDLTRLCLNLSESVHTLHRYGVILGDLHPGNVLVSPEGSVCWVDADSFQIEDYPCSVGTERFRAPELHGNFGDCLRLVRPALHDADARPVSLCPARGRRRDAGSCQEGRVAVPVCFVQTACGILPARYPRMLCLVVSPPQAPRRTRSQSYLCPASRFASTRHAGVSGALFAAIPQGYGTGRRKGSSHVPGSSA